MIPDEKSRIDYLNAELAPKNKITALHYAAYSGYADIVEMLVKSGANRFLEDSVVIRRTINKFPDLVSKINALNHYKQTPLHKAIRLKNLLALDILLDVEGIDVDAKHEGQSNFYRSMDVLCSVLRSRTRKLQVGSELQIQHEVASHQLIELQKQLENIQAVCSQLSAQLAKKLLR